jgi:hypothetical protein
MITVRRLFATAALVTAATFGAATPALAAPATSGTLTPTVNCIATSDQLTSAGYGAVVTNDTKNSKWAVLGYTNSGKSEVTIKPGTGQNKLRGVEGSVPESFAPGAQFGQGVALLPSSSASGTWTLSGTSVAISMTAAPACRNSEMPAEGNGMGAPIALLVSAAVGVAATLAARRRRRAA